MTERIQIFGVGIDQVDMQGAISIIFDDMVPDTYTCRYIVTPNVDHIVKLQKKTRLFVSYADATLVLADGMPVVWASRLLGCRLPGVVPGSDLVPAIFSESAVRGVPLRVFLLGAASGVGESAKKKIETLWPSISVVGVLSPKLKFEHDELECIRICQIVSEKRPDILIIGLGTPKQEIFINQYRHLIQTKVALCVGATIDFLAGEKVRAPLWMREVGLEWLFRLLLEPRRLLKRYAVDAVVFPVLIVFEFIKKLRKHKCT